MEAYYSSKKWKEDFAADESGEIPADIKRGVLSENGLDVGSEWPKEEI